MKYILSFIIVPSVIVALSYLLAAILPPLPAPLLAVISDIGSLAVPFSKFVRPETLQLVLNYSLQFTGILVVYHAGLLAFKIVDSKIS